jgi:hypothetical protein
MMLFIISRVYFPKAEWLYVTQRCIIQKLDVVTPHIRTYNMTKYIVITKCAFALYEWLYLDNISLRKAITAAEESC